MRGLTKAEILIVLAVMLIFIVASIPVYLRVRGDIAVCREFYPTMNTMDCYFSTKTVRVPR